MDLKNGQIVVDSRIISSGTTLEQFGAHFANEISIYTKNEKSTCRFKGPINLNGVDFWVSIKFRCSILFSIELKNADPRLNNTYENWSDETVGKKRKSHDQWLQTLLGKPHEISLPAIEYFYDWGTVTSYYDPRSGDCGIILNYQNRMHE